MDQKILVLGSNGQLGKELREIKDNFGVPIIFTTRETLDITSNDVGQLIKNYNPTVVINVSAYTQVDKAEKEIYQAMKANAYGLGYIAKACSEINAALIHVSTDYVYHNNVRMPIHEEASCQPKNMYGISKRMGEQFAMMNNSRTIIIRSSWIYSIFGNNFVKTMLKLSETKSELSIVSDQYGAPTNAADLASTIKLICLSIIEAKTENPWGIYNFANEGVTSWDEFARAIFELKQKEVVIKGITTQAYNAPAVRPLWSVMNLGKIKKKFGLQTKHWRASLEEMLIKFNMS